LLEPGRLSKNKPDRKEEPDGSGVLKRGRGTRAENYYLTARWEKVKQTRGIKELLTHPDMEPRPSHGKCV